MKLDLTPYEEPSKPLESSSEYTPPTAAPVDVGSRHHTALSLACSLISRGTPQTDLATIMNAVNQTYNPPLEQREVDALLKDTWARYSQELEIAYSPPLPKLGKAALYGLPGEIVKAIKPHTETSDICLLIRS